MPGFGESAYARFTPESGHSAMQSKCLWAISGHHCGSRSIGKLFMPLGTAILDGRLLGDPGLGATTLIPTTRRAAITMRTMERAWRMQPPSSALALCNRRHIGSNWRSICALHVTHRSLCTLHVTHD